MGGTNDLMSADEILARLREKDSYEDLGRGATEQEIRSAEDTLGVTFPAEYRKFLSECGYAFWFGISIFGIAPSPEDSVVHWTLTVRAEKLPDWCAPRPRNAVVVHDYGGGGYYFLYGAGATRGGEVVLVTDDALGAEVHAYANFWRFLQMFTR